MYRTFVIPLDGSALAEAVIPHIRRLAAPTQAKLVLVSNIELPVYPARDIGGVGVPSAPLGGDGYMYSYLRRKRAELRALGYTVTNQVVKGDTADSIVDIADEAEADCIAMTTHGRSGVVRMMLGSVAQRVVRRARRPVFLVRTTMPVVSETLLQRILVPLDGSALAEEGLAQARRLAMQTGAALLLVRVMRPLDETERDEFFASADERATSSDRLTLAQHYLDDLSRQLTEQKIQCDAQVLIGQPAQAILDLVPVAEIDCIAMSTHGRSGFTRLRYGSVAEAVLHGAPCPLLLVRRPAPAADAAGAEADHPTKLLIL